MFGRFYIMAYFGNPYVISYGAPIKLKHRKTGQVLHSHEINYMGGSRQQEVTCYGGRDDNDWWIVKGPDGEGINAEIGTPVLSNDVIRLEHLATSRNLHSHEGPYSPSSNQGEVTAYGTNGKGDNNDNWTLIIHNQGSGHPWHSTHFVKFIHVGTNRALHSHKGHKTASEQQEVTTFDESADDSLWQVEHL